MAHAPWTMDLLDYWRQKGDETTVEVADSNGVIREVSVDSYIRGWIEEIHRFAEEYRQTHPNMDAMPTYRKPEENLQSADTYGDVAIQGVLHVLFTSAETLDNMDGVMVGYFTTRTTDTTSRYSPETYQMLAAYFSQSSTLSQGIRAYFLIPREPSWSVDYALIQKGEEFYANHSFEIGTILLCASLPLCYCNSRGVKALVMTHALTRGVYMRIIETTRFAVGVMQPGALKHWESNGVRTAKNVRLLHAYNRYRLRTRVIDGQTWNEADWGAPLNQEDLAMTLMTFSTVVLDGLRKLGVSIPHEIEDAYFHAWRYVGFLIGIPDALIPDTAADGRALLETIAQRQFKTLEPGTTVSKDGKEIADALRDFIEGALARIHQNRLKGWPATKTRFLIGRLYADLLGVPRSDWTIALIGVIRALHWTEAALMKGSPQFNRLTQKASRLVFEGIAAGTHPDGRPMLLIPEDGAGISRLVTPPATVVSNTADMERASAAVFSAPISEPVPQTGAPKNTEATNEGVVN